MSTTAIRAAQDAATEAVHDALKTMIAAKEPLGTKRAARIIASQAFGAMVIPAEYVEGHRDAMTEVRNKLGPIVNADHWVSAADPEPEGPST